MTVRRSAAVALAAAALVSGCTKVSQEAPPPETTVAAFATPLVPNPNDLSLAAIPTLPASAQRSLLQAFVDAGGFPSDQAVSLTVPIVRYVFDAGANKYVPHAVQIDPATLTTATSAATFALLKVDGGTPVLVTTWEFDPAGSGTAADGASWTLAIRSKPNGAPGYGNRRWAPGRYVFALRGGPNGVKTFDGKAIGPDFAVQAALQNVTLDNPQHVPVGTPADKLALLENVRKALWLPLDWGRVSVSGIGMWAPAGAAIPTPYAAVSTVFPASELASFSTFEVSAGANALPNVPMPTAPVDSGSGVAPLPLDLLRTANHGATIAYNPAFGAAAQGLTSLDGFSTTAMVFAPVTVPVDASTANACNVHLFKFVGGVPVLQAEFKREAGQSVGAGCAPSGAGPSAAAYVIQPPPIITPYGGNVTPTTPCAATNGCSSVIGLQPAAGIPGAPYYLPPLDEATDYAVVITTSVTDMLGRPLQKSTIGKILTDPGFDAVATSSVDGTSLLAGIPNETATALQKMRMQLAPVLAALPGGRTAADVALAYTFRTQGGMTSTALGLVMAQWGQNPNATGVVDATFLSTTQVSQLYGIDGGLLVSPTGLASVAEVTFPTRSLLLESQNFGLFDPAHAATENVTALVALPDPALVSSVCNDDHPSMGYGATTRCAPLVVYSHGLTNSKEDLLPIAAALASRGFVVAAIDAEKHGQRSYCSGATQADADNQCCPAALDLIGGPGTAAFYCGSSTCVPKSNLVTPVDVNPDGTPMVVGVCEASGGVRRYMSFRSDFRSSALGCNPPTDNTGLPKPQCLSTKGPAFVNGNRLVTLNFFRVRDSMRQSVVDISALAKALAPIGQSGDAFAAELAARGLAVDFSRVYFVGHSYGAITGGVSLAVNPRLTRAVTYAGGATGMDVFSNPGSVYSAALNGLLGGAGIQPGTPDYLKTLQIGKWILDPAEPANYLHYVLPAVLPNPFPASLQAFFPSQPRDVLAEISLGDGSVPNAQNTYYAGRLGYPVPAAGSPATDSNVQWYIDPAHVGSTVSHGNLLDFIGGVDGSLTKQAQSNAAQFLVSPAGQAASVYP
jgi:hypothetical protein